jgi:hypothetical protein
VVRAARGCPWVVTTALLSTSTQTLKPPLRHAPVSPACWITWIRPGTHHRTPGWLSATLPPPLLSSDERGQRLGSQRVEAVLRIALPLIFDGSAIFIRDDVTRSRCVGLPHLTRYFTLHPATDLLLPASLWSRQSGGKLAFFLRWFRQQAQAVANNVSSGDLLAELDAVEGRIHACGADLASPFYDMNSFAIWNGSSTRARSVASLWLSDVTRQSSHVGYSFSFALAPAAAQVHGFQYRVTRAEYQYAAEQKCSCNHEHKSHQLKLYAQTFALHLQTFEACCTAGLEACSGIHGTAPSGRRRKRFV